MDSSGVLIPVSVGRPQPQTRWGLLFPRFLVVEAQACSNGRKFLVLESGCLMSALCPGPNVPVSYL